MGMYATSANELKVEFGKDLFVTFKMHADIGIDLVRWLTSQTKKIELMGKRAERMERAAVELDLEENERFKKLTGDAENLRGQTDQVAMCVEFIRKACLGWTDFYEDAAAEERKELLPFTDANIIRLGVMKLGVVLNAFNKHYGLVEESSVGEAKSGDSPEPSLPAGKEAGNTLSGIDSSTQIASSPS